MNSPDIALAEASPSADSSKALTAGAAVNVYHLHPMVAGPLESWPATIARVAEMGFSHLCLAPPFEPGKRGDLFAHATFDRLHPALQFDGAAEKGLEKIAGYAAHAGLQVMLDIAPGSIATDSPLAHQHVDWFVPPAEQRAADPRRSGNVLERVTPNFTQTAIAEAVSAWWTTLLGRWRAAGLAGYRCLSLETVPPSFWQALRQAEANSLLLAWTPGVARARLPALSGCGFDLTCSSSGWWDGRAAWFAEEQGLLSRIAPALAAPEPSFQERLAERLSPHADAALAYRLALDMAAATGAGLFVPMGFEYAGRRAFDPARAQPEDFEACQHDAPVDLASEIGRAIRTAGSLPAPRILRPLTAPGAAVTAFLRTAAADIRDAETATLILINPDLARPATADVTLPVLPSSAGVAMQADASDNGRLDPGEVRLLTCRRTEVIQVPATKLSREWAESTRIAVENVQPAVPDGDYPVKTIVGREVAVAADVFGDGHDILAADLLWRYADETGWRHVSMQKVVNDRWAASFRPDRVGLYQFAVEGWWDQWATYTHDLHAKVHAGQLVTLEIEEGRLLLKEALSRAVGDLRTRLTSLLEQSLTSEVLLGSDAATVMRQSDARPFAARSIIRSIRVDRPAAEFASWYELFPRSATHDPQVHGTFRSVIDRLPEIQAMGFDVLYFPPIHPIGTINRKGRNNSLRAEPGDVGSPYAIGSADGGHEAVHPALGTLDDFLLLQREARAHGLELAIDFAIQCAPDHPWVSQHKEWFRWRPDGSMRYAENPPKKYEDIVNPDFYSASSFPAVWQALRDVIRLWVDRGIRIFRVDNPHTKPLPFWQWMIADIQSTHPDVLFLAEAFTRPKLMYRLGKLGFSQSYTYFTWRNTKQEITEYLTEITEAPVADFFRPNFFVNTPDINPVFLQGSGRPGFLIRAALAATLSGLWGVYSGFEICESAPLPGREEYLDSEKYEVRPRNYAAPGNIVAEIARLNQIRRLNPALQSHLGLQFYAAANDQVILYGKRDPSGGSLILVAVSFDPHNVQEADIEVPLWEFDLPDDGAIAVTELMRDNNFTWYGKNQRIRLNPAEQPFYIWRLSRVGAI